MTYQAGQSEETIDDLSSWTESRDYRCSSIIISTLFDWVLVISMSIEIVSTLKKYIIVNIQYLSNVLHTYSFKGFSSFSLFSTLWKNREDIKTMK